MATEWERAKKEKERIDRQQEAMFERREGVLKRTGATEDIAGLAKQEWAKQSKWDKKWARRRWKIEAKKKYVLE